MQFYNFRKVYGYRKTPIEIKRWVLSFHGLKNTLLFTF